MKADKYQYIKNYYKVPACKNRIVKHKESGILGVITGVSGAHLKVALNGQKKSKIYHPIDFYYIKEKEE